MSETRVRAKQVFVSTWHCEKTDENVISVCIVVVTRAAVSPIRSLARSSTNGFLCDKNFRDCVFALLFSRNQLNFIVMTSKIEREKTKKQYTKSSVCDDILRESSLLTQNYIYFAQRQTQHTMEKSISKYKRFVGDKFCVNIKTQKVYELYEYLSRNRIRSLD